MDKSLNYYHNHIDEFNVSCGRNSSKYLRVLQWNVRGINDMSKFDNILLSIDHFVVPIDVIILGETWIKADNTGLYKINGYNSIFSSRENSSGGLAVYIRDTIKYNVLENLSSGGFHHISVELKMNGEKYEIHGVYRPPSFDFNVFYEFIECWLNKSNSHPCFIFGDVNVPVNLINNNVVLKYKYLLQSYNFLCSNSFVTRPASSNVLDHVICKMSEAHRLYNHTILNDVSDHSLILSEFGLRFRSDRVVLSKNIVNHDKLHRDFKSFIDTIGVIDNVDTCLSNIIAKYNTLLKNSTRTMSKTVNIKGTHCPWMNLELWSLIKLKNNYLKKCRKYPNDSNLAELLKHISSKLDVAKKQTKKRYYENLLNNTTHSKLWKNINSILGKSKTNTELTLNVNGQYISDAKMVCEAFNEHFSTVGCKLAQQIPSTLENPLQYINPISESCFLQPASINEVTLLINDLNSNKSSGPDCIPAKIIKNNVVAFSRILADSFNLIIETGLYPECLKVAKVIPIFKSGDRCLADNYRPISTSSVFNKIFEKLLVTRLMKFFDRNNVLYSMQYGFRSGCSSSIAITELVEKILEETDSKKFVGALFLDLKKAFDTLDHNILLSKLDLYGIRGVVNNIIRSYLNTRKQLVSIDGVNSSLKEISTGVPQGSNIGPLLFLIYINDICKINLKGTPRLFADDTALFYPNIIPELITTNMCEDLRLLQSYFACNLLSLNLKKTKYMIFRSPRKAQPNTPSIIIGTAIIEKVDSFKYLGLTLDCTLSWDQHIKTVCNKISAMCGVLKRVVSYLPRKALLLFYYAHIHSHLNYLTLSWGRACKSKLKKLQTLQNRCLKIIFNLPILFSTVRLYTELPHRALPILGICEQQTLQMVHNVLHNPLLHHNITLNIASRIHNTRQFNTLSRSRAHSNFGQKRFSFLGPSKYNVLPRHLQQITNSLSFKTNLKEFLRRRIPHLLI